MGRIFTLPDVAAGTLIRGIKARKSGDGTNLPSSNFARAVSCFPRYELARQELRYVGSVLRCDRSE